MNDKPALYQELGIAADHIDPDALAVVRRIAHSGAHARFIGGCVRDLLLGRRPEDFDIVTPISLRRVRRIFGRSSRMIGRRHRLVHVLCPNGKIIEVSTYPTPEEPAPGPVDHQSLDAWRRDFTINALYYDPIDGSLIDYVRGVEDIRSRLLRSVRPPRESFQEDPVRIMRGIRYACLLDLTIEPETWAAMVEFAPSVASVNKMRMQEEIWKFLLRPGTDRIFRLFAELGIFPIIFPELISFVDPEKPGRLWEYLAAKDEIPKQELTQILALGVLLLPLLDEIEELKLNSLDEEAKRLSARCRKTIESMGRLYSVAKETRYGAVSILEAQLYLLRGPDGVRASQRSEGGRRSPVDSRYFEQALALLRVLCRARGADDELVQAWNEEAGRRRAHPPRHQAPPRRKRRRRRRSSRPRRRRA